MQTLRDKTVVITGAAGGIGAALAHACSREGAHLALVDRDSAGLTRLSEQLSSEGRATQRVSTHRCDLGDMAAVRALPATVLSSHPSVHVLVNNAGLTVFGALQDQHVAEIDTLLDVDLRAVVHACRAFTPHLASSAPAHIVNISSLAGFLPLPTQSTYCAAKHAVRGFSESLRIELAPQGIGVTTVMPGAVATSFLGSAPSHNRAFTDILQRKMVAHGICPDRLARAITRAIKRNRARLIMGWDAQLTRFLQQLAPSLLPLVLTWAWRRYRGQIREEDASGPAGPPPPSYNDHPPS